MICKIRLQVTYTRKLVDATCCETIVPSSSPPGFRVANGVNFMPVNGKKFLNANEMMRINAKPPFHQVCLV